MYIGTQPAIGQNRKLDSIASSFDGVLTTFNLTVNTSSIVPSNVYQLFISLGGVLQNPGVDFTVSGNQITFTTAPTAGLSFFGIFQGDSITGTPTIADASITTAKLATGLTVTHTAGTAAAPSITFAGDTANGAFAPAANTFGIATGGTERLRIDSSGRLLIGVSTALDTSALQIKSSANPLNAQTNGDAGTFTRFVASVDGPFIFQSKSRSATLGTHTIVQSGDFLGGTVFSGSDGTTYVPAVQISAQVDGTPGLNNMPGRFVISVTQPSIPSPVEALRVDSGRNTGFSGIPYPRTDNFASNGTSGNRWTAIYAVNGTIQTSDQREKTLVTNSSLGTAFIKSLRPVSYKWVEGGKQQTGKYDADGHEIIKSVPGHRTHWGFIAQEVKEAVDAAGVDFGGWILTDKDDPDSQQGLRYDQFIAPLTKALQEALAEIEILKAKVTVLENV